MMPKEMSIVTHPEVHNLISIHIPDLGSLRIFYIERVRWKVMDIMGNATRHDLPGSPEKGFGFGSFLSVKIRVVFQGSTS
jgi:hypothetical protein